MIEELDEESNAHFGDSLLDGGNLDDDLLGIDESDLHDEVK